MLLRGIAVVEHFVSLRECVTHELGNSVNCHETEADRSPIRIPEQ